MFGDFFSLYIQDMNIYYQYLSIFFKNNTYLIRNGDYNSILCEREWYKRIKLKS